MKKLIFKSALSVIAVAMLASCSLTKRLYGVSEVDVPLSTESVKVEKRYRNLDKTISLSTKSNVLPEDVYNDEALPKKTRAVLPKYNFTPSPQRFAQDATGDYVRQLGFEISPGSEYSLAVELKTFNLTWLDKQSMQANVALSYRFTNNAGETIIPSTTVVAREKLGPYEQFGLGLGRVYGMALAKIDWDRIAECLTVAKRANEEKNAAVRGEGDTALEHTVIRWFINSTPQGADVSWRVISSTPDVSNTNSNYVGTTPYETTESFDIKGMTYNNSGNVQIEITCERPGYLPQKKRFNVRQAIDQKEISAKFNLVKDE